MGAFLLARFDSGSLVGLIRDGGHPDIRMVTLGFEEFRGRFKDEIPIAEKTARHSGTRNTTQILGNREFQDDWPRIFEAMNQLCTDETNTWLVSKGVREVGLKVSHSGAGGENFLGTPLVPRNSGLDMHNEMAFGHSNGLSLRLFPSSPRDLPAALLGAQAPGLVALWPGLEGGRFHELRAVHAPGTFPPAESGFRGDWSWTTRAPTMESEGWFSPRASGLARVILLKSTWYLRNQLLREADWVGMNHPVEFGTPRIDWKVFITTMRGLVARKASGKNAFIQSARVSLSAFQGGGKGGLCLTTWFLAFRGRQGFRRPREYSGRSFRKTCSRFASSGSSYFRQLCVGEW